MDCNGGLFCRSNVFTKDLLFCWMDPIRSKDNNSDGSVAETLIISSLFSLSLSQNFFIWTYCLVSLFIRLLNVFFTKLINFIICYIVRFKFFFNSLSLTHPTPSHPPSFSLFLKTDLQIFPHILCHAGKIESNHLHRQFEQTTKWALQGHNLNQGRNSMRFLNL